MRTVGLFLLNVGLLCGQTFEVASVKPASDDSANAKKGGALKLTSANLNLQAASLWDMIAAAYDIRDYQLSGPDWMKSARFDVTAKSPGEASLDERRTMLKALLADRFKLAVHHDTKELTMAALVAGKGKPKLGDPKTNVTTRDTVSIKDGKMIFENFSMSQLATYLSRGNPDGPLIDATGIEGRYDFAVELDSGPDAADIKRGLERSMQDGSMMRMVAEQIGLKVERRKLPTDIVVVDHAERVPAEN